MDMDNIESNLIKKFVKDTQEARLSFLERLEEKYVKTQDQCDVIDLHSFIIVENHGTLAKLKNGTFGSLTSYSCPEGRRTLKVLKKIVKIKRRCKITEKDLERNLVRTFIGEEYIDLLKSSDNSIWDTKETRNNKISANQPFQKPNKHADLPKIQICDLSFQNLNCKSVQNDVRRFEPLHSASAANQQLLKNRLSFKTISSCNRYNVQRRSERLSGNLGFKKSNYEGKNECSSADTRNIYDLSNLTICDLRSKHLNKKGAGSFTGQSGMDIDGVTSNAINNSKPKRKLFKFSVGKEQDNFRKLHEKGTNLLIDLEEEIKIYTEYSNGVKDNFYYKQAIEFPLYSYKFFKDNQENDILKKKSSIYDSSPASQFTKIRPLPCPSIRKRKLMPKY